MITDVADAAGMYVHNLLFLEEGRQKDLRVSTLVRLAQALRCRPGTLLPDLVAAYRRLRPEEETSSGA